MAYSIGQYHSKQAKNSLGEYCYVNDITNNIVDNDSSKNGIQAVEVQGILTETSEHDATSITFKDNAIALGKNGDGKQLYFEEGKCYYLIINIDRNVGYDIKYDIRLVNLIENQDTDKNIIKYLYNETGEYQQLKRVIVEKGSADSVGSTVNVVVYRDESGGKQVRLLEDGASYNESDYNTYVEENGGIIKEFKPQRGTINTSDWLNIDVNKSAYKQVCIAFKPCKNFNGILIKKEIETIDYQLSYVENGKQFQGIETKVSEPELYGLNNIVLSNNDNNDDKFLTIPSGSVIKKIGIWGRSGLGFMINGEEIHIGARGYYELNLKDINVKSICPIALDEHDRFLIDYEYEREGA